MKTLIALIVLTTILTATALNALMVAQTDAEAIGRSVKVLEKQAKEGEDPEEVLDPNINLADVNWHKGTDFIPEISMWFNTSSRVSAKTVQMLPGADAAKMIKADELIDTWLVARFSQNWATLATILKKEQSRDILLIAAMRAAVLAEEGSSPHGSIILFQEEENALRKSILPALKKIAKQDGNLEGVKSYVRIAPPSFHLILMTARNFPGEIADMATKKVAEYGGGFMTK